jgi:tetrahydromethanopterin S-methyltransferase subunit G
MCQVSYLRHYFPVLAQANRTQAEFQNIKQKLAELKRKVETHKVEDFFKNSSQ